MSNHIPVLVCSFGLVPVLWWYLVRTQGCQFHHQYGDSPQVLTQIERHVKLNEEMLGQISLI